MACITVFPDCTVSVSLLCTSCKGDHRARMDTIPDGWKNHSQRNYRTKWRTTEAGHPAVHQWNCGVGDFLRISLHGDVGYKKDNNMETISYKAGRLGFIPAGAETMIWYRNQVKVYYIIGLSILPMKEIQQKIQTLPD